ncbi:MAG: FixH family protein [Anaerolineae bacterium]|nr:FixH family protein [Anaerolineae bacterium]
MRVKVRESKFALVMLILVCVLAGCRQSAQQADSADLTITLDSSAAFAVGKTELTIVVKDAQGNPVDDATIEVTGDMSHAGMKPELGSVQKGTQGQYKVPFIWSMGGDWILTVKVTLPDGRSTSKRFDVAVNS